MTKGLVSYLRVSTKKQEVSGLGLDAQRDAVASYAKGRPIIREFVEIESGGRDDRPIIAEAIAFAKANGCKIVIAKLDRLTRDLHFLTGLQKAGVDFTACDMPDASPLTVHIMAAMAQHERTLISTRTRDGLKALKERGVTKKGLPVKLGGDRGKLDLARSAQTAKALDKARSVLPMIERIRSSGTITAKGIADELNYWKVPTSRGGMWSAVQVQRVLQRAA